MPAAHAHLGPHTRLDRHNPAPGDPFHPSATPIYQTATFAQESAAEFGEYDYSRSGNPTRTVLERQLAAIEDPSNPTSCAPAFTSGLAALSAAVRALHPGDELLASDDLYGGSYRLFSRILEPRGVSVRYADLSDTASLDRHFSARTRLVHIETPTNPLLRIIDIRAVADAAHARGARLLVDSTAASPWLQRPLELGADIVLHSATKLLNGHADVSAGALVVRDAALAGDLAFIQNAEGAALAPFDSFLLLRGLKTLGVRVERQQHTALRAAEFLAAHPLVSRVFYPGLSAHPGHDLHARQSARAGEPRARTTGTQPITPPCGGVVLSFLTIDDSPDTAPQVVESLDLFSIAVSFGSTNSTASLPCRMSHASIPAAVRSKRQLPENLIRLSIGLEDAHDLTSDLDRALTVAINVRDHATTPVAADRVPSLTNT